MTPRLPSFATSTLASLFVFALTALPACAAQIAPTASDDAVGSSESALTSTTKAEWHTGPVPGSPYLPDCPACKCDGCGVVKNGSLVVSVPPGWQVGDVEARVYDPTTEVGTGTLGSKIDSPGDALAMVTFLTPFAGTGDEPATSKRVVVPNAPPEIASLAQGTKLNLFSMDFCSGQSCGDFDR
jgi:hypothetical protein